MIVLSTRTVSGEEILAFMQYFYATCVQNTDSKNAIIMFFAGLIFVIVELEKNIKISY
jgi:hypothetical protein